MKAVRRRYYAGNKPTLELGKGYGGRGDVSLGGFAR